jgi:hypothetical protein
VNQAGLPRNVPCSPAESIALESVPMNPHGKILTGSHSAAGQPVVAPRKPYSPPRLRSLGQVNEVTAGKGSLGEDQARRKPQG